MVFGFLKSLFGGGGKKGKETDFRIKSASEELISLPEIENLSETDVKYPLLKPFARAHISWDSEEEELVYKIDEPSLSEEDRNIFESLKGALEKKIDVSITELETGEEVVDYLASKTDELLDELGFDLSGAGRQKLLYFVYRNFAGLNEIEPLMHDPYIEDIGCSGTGIPVYIVHSKFGSIKTDLVFEDEKNLKKLVVKLAERCGKYVSYSEPLLDGALPDGSRVNASLTEDVTTQGPTFSIRKFQEVPYSAVDMLDFGTANLDIMAYFWMLMEHQKSLLIAGGTASGKTSFLNSIVAFIPPAKKIVSIEDSVTGDTEIEMLVNGKKTKKPIEEVADPLIDARGEEMADGAERANIYSGDSICVATIDEEYSLDYRKPAAVYRHKTTKDIYRIKTASGREVRATADHSLFTLDKGRLVEVRPGDAEEQCIATPRILGARKKTPQIDVLQTVRDKERVFVEGSFLESLYDQVDWEEVKSIGDISESGFKYWRRKGMIRGKELQALREQGEIEVNGKGVVRVKGSGPTLPLKLDVGDKLAELWGLWLGDGSYDFRNENVVLVTTNDWSIKESLTSVAAELGIGHSIKPDGTVSLNSVLLYELMRGIGFNGRSASKKIPDFCRNMSAEHIGQLLKGYFSADGGVKKHEVSCSSQSHELLRGVQDLLLRLGIVSNINDYERSDGCIELSISSKKFLQKFAEKVGFIQERKMEMLDEAIERSGTHHEKNDIIPTDPEFGEEVHENYEIQWNYRNNVNNLGRKFLQEIAISTKEKKLDNLAFSDIYWDRVISVEKIDVNEEYVYDISVPGPERFVGNNILLHNTRELQLPHENWIPSVARTGFGGKETDIDMFRLLKESFRQNPDYVIVGEVRGEEASVLFQGMSSGHPSIGTIHASSPSEVVKRLTTPPIELSPSLVETLDAIVVMTKASQYGKSARRVKGVYEVEAITPEGSPRTNQYISWTPIDDTFSIKGRSNLVNEIRQRFGFTGEEIEEEIEDRKRVLKWMRDKGYTSFPEVSRIVSEYYKDPDKILKAVDNDSDELDTETEGLQGRNVSADMGEAHKELMERKKEFKAASEDERSDKEDPFEDVEEVEENPFED
ncbi:MAG: ATPase, T2SS/T4P/T4SS family [Candidatus Nanohaloarchaea archaeon]|nr:ATPase, T2SS/T4P/T4SS family [Candidatus Nanohaloarchaea archaeon]